MADASTGRQLLVLFESAGGFALLETVAGGGSGNDIARLVQKAKVGDTELADFSKVVKLRAFQPFTSAEEALTSINDLSEGMVPPTLRTFLVQNVPGATDPDASGSSSSSSAATTPSKGKGGKAPAFELGVLDSKLGQSIGSQLGLRCRAGDDVWEISRGVRQHLSHFVPGLSSAAAQQAQLGLGHSYSRAKVKFDVNRSDNMVIQASALLDQLDKDANTLAMRAKEWYGWHFPEMPKIVKDSTCFCRAALVLGNKEGAVKRHLKEEAAAGGESGAASGGGGGGGGDDSDDDDEEEEEQAATEEEEEEAEAIAGLGASSGRGTVKEQLTEALAGDDTLAEQVLAAAASSTGMSLSAGDLACVLAFCRRVVGVAELRQQLADYLSGKMQVVAPNLRALIGDSVGARLIAHAGSLTSLAKAAASTVQILGAEKALFRALKTKGNTPKYGLLFHSSFIGHADTRNKGRISRYLANKCSIAARIDAFSDVHAGGGVTSAATEAGAGVTSGVAATGAYGDRLREQVEERLGFYQGGSAGAKGGSSANRSLSKNVDAMQEAKQEAERRLQEGGVTSGLGGKRKRSEASDDGEGGAVAMEGDSEPATPAKKARSSSVSSASKTPEGGDASASGKKAKKEKKDKKDKSAKKAKKAGK